MTHREDALKKEWDVLLKENAFVGGNLYFMETSPFVGQVNKIENLRDGIRFHFEWCATETKQRGWTRRRRYYVKLRREPPLMNHSEGALEFGSSKLFLRGRNLLEERHIVEPLTHRERRERRRQLRPLPLFDR